MQKRLSITRLQYQGGNMSGAGLLLLNITTKSLTDGRQYTKLKCSVKLQSEMHHQLILSKTEIQLNLKLFIPFIVNLVFSYI